MMFNAAAYKGSRNYKGDAGADLKAFRAGQLLAMPKSMLPIDGLGTGFRRVGNAGGLDIEQTVVRGADGAPVPIPQYSAVVKVGSKKIRYLITEKRLQDIFQHIKGDLIANNWITAKGDKGKVRNRQIIGKFYGATGSRNSGEHRYFVARSRHGADIGQQIMQRRVLATKKSGNRYIPDSNTPYVLNQAGLDAAEAAGTLDWYEDYNSAVSGRIAGSSYLTRDDAQLMNFLAIKGGESVRAALAFARRGKLVDGVTSVAPRFVYAGFKAVALDMPSVLLEGAGAVGLLGRQKRTAPKNPRMTDLVIPAISADPEAQAYAKQFLTPRVLAELGKYRYTSRSGVEQSILQYFKSINSPIPVRQPTATATAEARALLDNLIAEQTVRTGQAPVVPAQGQ